MRDQHLDHHLDDQGAWSRDGLEEQPGSGDPAMTLDTLLAEARAGMRRVPAHELEDAVAAGALVVDVRPQHQRERDGDLPGAVVIDRNVLEWRLSPTSDFRLGLTDDPSRPVVLVCDEGFSSSLAAHNLRRLGLRRATDLVGGYQAWLAWQRGFAPPAHTST